MGSRHGHLLPQRDCFRDGGTAHGAARNSALVTVGSNGVCWPLGREAALSVAGFTPGLPSRCPLWPCVLREPLLPGSPAPSGTSAWSLARAWGPDEPRCLQGGRVDPLSTLDAAESAASCSRRACCGAVCLSGPPPAPGVQGVPTSACRVLCVRPVGHGNNTRFSSFRATLAAAGCRTRASAPPWLDSAALPEAR